MYLNFFSANCRKLYFSRYCSNFIIHFMIHLKKCSPKDLRNDPSFNHLYIFLLTCRQTSFIWQKFCNFCNIFKIVIILTFLFSFKYQPVLLLLNQNDSDIHRNVSLQILMFVCRETCLFNISCIFNDYKVQCRVTHSSKTLIF